MKNTRNTRNTRNLKKFKKLIARIPFKNGILIGVVCFLLVVISGQYDFFSAKYNVNDKNLATAATIGDSLTEVLLGTTTPPMEQLDKVLYDKKMLTLANNPLVKCATSTPATSTSGVAGNAPSNTIASGTKPAVKTANATPKTPTLPLCSSLPTPKDWPVKAPYPNAGALLPFNRIVAYYGNFYSTKMGVLGQYPPEQMIPKLLAEVAKWKAADPETPVIPAIDYIAVTAQGSPGNDGKYRLRMPDSEIQKAITLASKVNGIVILDVQVGLSTVQAEIPPLEKYLKLPNVHLAIDPEFSMKTGKKPGSIIGTMNADDVNFTAQYLAKIVKENNIPPKILVVHRFTQHMITSSSAIKPLPEVQVVIDMDGWGAPSHKKKAYLDVITEYPVQFTGFKLFYKNDLLGASSGMMMPSQVLNLHPIPSFIQYQ